MLDGYIPWPPEFAARYRALGYWRGETLGALMRHRAAATPEAIAVVDGDRRYTYRQLDEHADRLAAALQDLPIAPQERVLLQLPNCLEFPLLCIALFRLGAIPIMALPALRETEVVHLANQAEAVAYIIPQTHLGFDYRTLTKAVRSRVGSLRHTIVVGESRESASAPSRDAATPIPFSDLEANPVDLPEPSSGAVALLLLSGGTTGAPKLIPRTHDDYCCNIRLSVQATQLDDRSRYLTALPAAHNFALGCPGMFGTLAAGGMVVCCGDPSPETAFALIDREAITVSALVPPLVGLWLDAAADGPPQALRSLDLLQVGGARLKPELAARVQPGLGCKLQQVYGMAEGLLNFTHLDDPNPVLFESQGCPVADDDELRIVDTQDVEVPSGHVGELLTRGPYTIRGYYRAEEYNQGAFTPDGFYRTGDLVRRLPSGHLVVEGRRKEVINRGGEKVPTEDVENHLLGHPKVRDVAIVGIPDESLGERTCACVIPRGPLTLPELNRHLRKLGMAAFKLPDHLLLFDEFPQTSLGKTNRQSLANEAQRLITAARTTKEGGSNT